MSVDFIRLKSYEVPVIKNLFWKQPIVSRNFSRASAPKWQCNRSSILVYCKHVLSKEDRGCFWEAVVWKKLSLSNGKMVGLFIQRLVPILSLTRVMLCLWRKLFNINYCWGASLFDHKIENQFQLTLKKILERIWEQVSCSLVIILRQIESLFRMTIPQEK